MRKTVTIIAAALFSAGIAFGRCPLNFIGADQAATSVYVEEIAGGKVLAEHNAQMLLTPASVMKSVTAAAAISAKGGDYKWTTRVIAVGTIRDGVLEGNLIIEGSGDPTLGSGQFKDDRTGFVDSLISAARSKGISRIAGKIEQAAPWPDQGAVPSWELEDIPGIDGAGFYRLNYMDNIFFLSYPSGSSTPNIPGLEVKRKGGQGGLWFTRNPGSNEIRVYGQLAKRQKRATLKCSMPDPPAVLLNEVGRAFSIGNKDFSNLKDTIEILSYTSPALRDVVRSLMVRSDNQMAEATLRLQAPGKGRGSAIKAERAELAAKGVNLGGARIADGSGLSRHNAISARQLAQVLRVMAGNGDFVGSFARVGLDGTVRNFMNNMPGRENLLLKSGSMTGVVCYVGYRLDPETKAPTHVIAIMINNAPEPSKARAAIAEFLSKLDFT